MDTARMTFNEAVHVLAAGHTNDMAAQVLAIHRQRDRAEAALKMELAAKDARIAELEAELDRVWGRCAMMKNTNNSLKTQVAALDALVSERAVAAEQQHYDDLSGSVLAEEAYAAAATAQQQQYDDPSGAIAQAEEVLDLTGEDEAAPAPALAAAAAPKPKRKACPGTLAWMAYVQHVKATQPEALVGAAKECEKLMAIKGIRAADPQGYTTFVAAWKDQHKDVVAAWNEEHSSEAEDAPATQGGGAAPAAPRADPRIFAKLVAVLAEGTKLSVGSAAGDRWEGAYTKEGLIFQGRAFKSPMAVTKAHAERITERHPKVTKPGSGWVWLRIENGPYKGKSLSQAYDAFYA